MKWKRTINILLILFVISLISAEWEAPYITLENDMVMIIPINATGDTNSSRIGIAQDINPINGSINFTNMSSGGGSSDGFISGGRDGDGAYYTAGSAFLGNNENPFKAFNRSGTLCFAWYKNESHPNSDTVNVPIVTAGNAGGTSFQISFLNTVPPRRFRVNNQCTTSEIINTNLTAVGNYTINGWHSICYGWSGAGLSSSWLSVTNESNVTQFGATNESAGGTISAGSGGNVDCGWSPQGATGSNFRFGADRSDGAGVTGMVFDSIMFWNRNITVDEIRRFHFQNWTTIPLRMNASNVSIGNFTHLTQSSINFNLSLNSTKNFTAYFMLNETSCNNPPTCSGTTWKLICLNSCANTTNYNINTTLTNFEENWNRESQTNGTNVPVIFNLELSPAHYVYFINGTQLNTGQGRTYANYSTNASWFNVTSLANILNITESHMSNRTYFNFSTINFNVSINATNIIFINVSFNTTANPSGTYSASRYNLTRAGGQSIHINNISLTMDDGDYFFIMNISDTDNNNNQTTFKQFFIDTIAPLINTTHPLNESNNVTNKNFTVFITATDRKLANVTMWVIRNGSTPASFERVHALHFGNVTSENHLIEQELNFSIEGNYTLEIMAFDGNRTNEHSDGNQHRRNVSFYIDLASPAVNLTSVGEGQQFTTQTVNLTFNVTDFQRNGEIRCSYNITIGNTSTFAIGGTESSFNCNATMLSFITTASLADATTYKIGFNATDGVQRNTSTRVFRVEVGGSGSGSGGSSGGDGSSPPTVISGSEKDYSFESILRQEFDDFISSPESQEERSIFITNKGNEITTFSLTCSGDVCDWVTFSENNFALEQAETKEVLYTVQIPKEIINEQYIFTIVGNADNTIKTIEVTVRISRFFGFLFKEKVYRPFAESQPIVIAYIYLLAIAFLLPVFIGIVITFFIENKKNQGTILFYSLLVAILATIITLVILI